MKGRSAAGCALHPGASAVRLGDLAHDGEADSGALAPAAAPTEAPEHLEDQLAVLGGNAAAIVRHHQFEGVGATVFDDIDLLGNEYGSDGQVTAVFLSFAGTASAAEEAATGPPLIDHLWLIVSAALVFLTQAGFLCFEVGAVQSKSVKAVAMKNIVDWVSGFAIGSLL